MKNRYYFFKRLYPHFVIVFDKKGKYISLGFDKFLIKYLPSDEISYIVINNQNKITIMRKYPNKYKRYLIKIVIFNEIKTILKNNSFRKNS